MLNNISIIYLDIAFGGKLTTDAKAILLRRIGKCDTVNPSFISKMKELYQ